MGTTTLSQWRWCGGLREHCLRVLSLLKWLTAHSCAPSRSTHCALIASSTYDCRAYFLVSYLMSNICSWHSCSLPDKCQMSIRSTALCHIPLSQNQKLTLSEDDLLKHYHLPGDMVWRRTMHCILSSVLLNMPRNYLIPTLPCTHFELVWGVVIPFSDRYTQSEPTWWCCQWDLHWKPTGVLSEELLWRTSRYF